MRVSKNGSRAIGMGLVFALAGFTYAVTSGVPRGDSFAAAPRAIGTYLPLRFTTPVVTAGTTVPGLNEYDLGDASLGSVIIRTITAEGGVKPYRFTSTGPLSLANAIANTSSTLTLGISGVLAGKTPGTIPLSSKTVLGTPGLRFQADVRDARGGTQTGFQTGFFNLFLFDTKGPVFRFANDTLPAARLDSAYTAQLGVLGGHSPVTVSALSVTDMGSGMATELSKIGLFLSPDGTIYGRPLAVGTYTITARGTDASGAIAKSRKNPGANDQTVTLVVADYPVTSSDTMTKSCTVSGDTSASGRDSLRLSGLINALGQDQFSLRNSDFVFQLAGIGFTGRLDQNGRLTQKNPDGSSFSVNVNVKAGTISVSATRGSFIKLFDVTNVLNGNTVRRPLKIAVGEAVFSSEVLDFAASVRGTRYDFNFSQSGTGLNASGGFQIVSVKGRDGVALTGNTGDSWQVNFVAQGRAGVTNPSGLREGLDNITAVNIRVGSNFAQSFSGAGVIGASTVNIHGGPVDGVQSFKLNTGSGKGTLVTRVLSTLETSIPQAQSALSTSNLFFSLGVDIRRADLDAPYTGEHARRIFNFGNQYKDQPARRGTPPV